MIDLGKALKENQRSAKLLLKSSENQVCQFDSDNMPFVLIEYDGEIIDAEVSKAYLSNNEILLYLSNQDEWINDTDCLNFTANNIYTEIEDMINKQD